jgi:hypothetical protein
VLAEPVPDHARPVAVVQGPVVGEPAQIIDQAQQVRPVVAAGPLDRLREWLVDNNATVMAVLLLVIGVSVIGKGIASF